MRLKLRFYECEHGGDLGAYEDDLKIAGATILQTWLDEDAEEAIVEIEVEDRAAFGTKFLATDASDFADICAFKEPTK